MSERQKTMKEQSELAGELLRRQPKLLQGFHYEDAIAFLCMGVEERYGNGDTVQEGGKAPESMVMIVQGSVSIWNENIEIGSLESGSLIGESLLFTRRRMNENIRSESDVTLLRFQRDDLLNYFRKRPGKLFNIYTRNIIEIQRERLDTIRQQVANLKRRLLEKENWY